MKKNILLLLLLAASLCLPAFAINKKPFTIPEVKEWKGAEGTLTLSGRIVCNGVGERRIAQQLADDYRQMFGTALTIAQGKAQKGDIVLSLKAPKTLGEEGYTMSINAQATIAAANRKGLYWGTRTLLQLAEQSETRTLPCLSLIHI